MYKELDVDGRSAANSSHAPRIGSKTKALTQMPKYARVHALVMSPLSWLQSASRRFINLGPGRQFIRIACDTMPLGRRGHMMDKRKALDMFGDKLSTSCNRHHRVSADRRRDLSVSSFVSCGETSLVGMMFDSLLKTFKRAVLRLV